MEDRGFHHAFIGLAILLVGFILVLIPSVPLWIQVVLVFVGGLIFEDDFCQHAIQRTEPEYRSPLNRLYGRTLWRVPWIQKLNRWADRLFGRKV